MKNQSFFPSEQLYHFLFTEENPFDKKLLEQTSPSYGIPVEDLGNKNLRPYNRYATKSYNAICEHLIYDFRDLSCCDGDERTRVRPTQLKPGEKVVVLENVKVDGFVDPLPRDERVYTKPTQAYNYKTEGQTSPEETEQ